MTSASDHAVPSRSRQCTSSNAEPNSAPGLHHTGGLSSNLEANIESAMACKRGSDGSGGGDGSGRTPPILPNNGGLPQLAVLAKILCLLMVVMCGAVPAMVRSVSLYSTCSSGNVTVIGRSIKAMGRDDHNAPYQKLTTQSEDFSRKLYIFAEKSQRYICFNKRWKLVGLPKKQKGPMCQFYEVYNGSYLRYKSVADETRFLGFNKFGKPMKNPHGRQECFNFIKYNPHADINHHNSLVNAEMGGMEPREPYVVSRKPSPVMRATKNSLLQADSAREFAHTSTHRHRHSNRWKLRQDGADSAPRRRHESRLLVEANKY